MNRRGFLGSILALAAAPAIVRADSLMRIIPTTTTVLESGLVGEVALLAAIRKVWEAGGEPDVIQCSPAFAQQISGEFLGTATRFHDSFNRQLVGRTVYVSDYGVAKVVVERDIPHDFIVRSSGGFAEMAR